ncbi:MAG: replication factor C small subunit [Candidatus ainarchaeum sp.]|nr:replication factor C small subunit [Candidatus ainarchaeum sp.]
MPELPWIEKYRPAKLADVIGQKEIIRRLESYVKQANVPNLLFSGPAGVGKTSAAVALAKELFGKDFERNFLELNASVTPETPILVKRNEKIFRTNFSELAQNYFLDEQEKNALPTGLETLSVNLDGKICFMPVSLISRHKISTIAKIKFDGGKVETSLNHSVIVLDSFGNFSAKECGKIEKGDILLSFSDSLSEKQTQIDFEKFAPILANELRSGTIKNPRVYVNLKQITIDADIAWLFGLYLAEGCAGLMNKRKTSGYVIFTLGYPQEKEIAEKTAKILQEKFGVQAKTKLGASGFDRSKKSSIQVQAFNTQLAKFFRENFYSPEQERKFSHSKRVPSFVFSLPLQLKIDFLKGYMGDASGEWGRMVRYSSVSKENLIDVAWLARTCGLDCSLYKKELRIVWKKSSASNLKTDLFPTKPIIEAFKREGIDFNYFMRHALYSKKSKRMSKKLVIGFIETLPFEKQVRLEKLKKALQTALFGVEVKSINKEPFNDWVYDFSVPESEMFFGGTAPVLLHNSDSRGIDVVRGTIKDFARTLAFNANFKIIFLDESDALTTDAQQALRRTMEKFTRTCRFILSCNYSSRILEPIQSRCVVFRYKPLSSKEMQERLKEIAEKESLKIDQKALDAIIYVSMGDMRKAVNILQACASLEKNILEKTVFDVSSRARPEEIKQMIELALGGNFLDARKKLDELMFEHGMSAEDIMLQLYREIIDAPETEIPSKTRIALVDTIGEYDFRIVEGANERIQLEALLAQFLKYAKK